MTAIIRTPSAAPEPTRRDILALGTAAVGAAGVAAVAWPFIHQMNPDSATIAARRADRVRPRPDRRGPDRAHLLARQADLRAPPHAR